MKFLLIFVKILAEIDHKKLCCEISLLIKFIILMRYQSILSISLMFLIC